MIYEAVIISEQQLEYALQKVEAMRTDGAVYLKACPAKEKRRLGQNARYWAILGQIADQLKRNNKLYSVEQWHEDFKMLFLGAEELDLPSGSIVVRPLSSAKLTVGEFSDYMECVEAWAIERGVILNDLPETFSA